MPDDSALEEELPMSSHLADAMQLAWNDWCQDTGCVPDGFQIHGPATTRVVMDLRHGEQFVRNVVTFLGKAGYRIVSIEDAGIADAWHQREKRENRFATGAKLSGEY